MDTKGELRQWLSPESGSTLNERARCFETPGDLHRVAAVEAALDAYFTRRLLGSHPQDFAVQGLERYSPLQLFFVTFCALSCGAGRRCDHVLRHVRSFARAFQCPVGMPLSPAVACPAF